MNQMMSKNAILENFIQHTSVIPEQTEGMNVVTIGNLTLTNSGLPCDTFNVIHVTGNFNAEVLNKVLKHFRDQSYPFCCWISEEYVNDHSLLLLLESGLERQAEEAGMILDLAHYESIISDKHQNIRQATTPAMVHEFSRVIAENWTPPDQNVITFYDKTAQTFIANKDRVSLLTYYQEGLPVATVEVFATDNEVIGIHGLATLEDTRGQGIGSALMTKVLNDAKALGYKQAVLLATEDGSGIYQKLGFHAVTTYYEYA